MQPTSRIQGIALFAVVVLVLFAFVWGGIYWAKGRSDHYATQSSGGQQQPEASPQPAPQEAPKESPQEQQQAPQPQPSAPPAHTNDQQKPAVASAQTQVPAVPSTGPEEVFLTVFTTAITGFAAAKYFQQRRRLNSYR